MIGAESLNPILSMGDTLVASGSPMKIDLSMSLPSEGLEAFQVFLKNLKEQCQRLGLQFLLIHHENLHHTKDMFRCGRWVPGFHLDFFSHWDNPGDPFAELSHFIQDHQGVPINPPGRAKLFTDKANSHAELARHDLGLPRTSIFRPGVSHTQLIDSIKRFLSEERKSNPGSLFLKKANGFGNRGVSNLKTKDSEELARIISNCMQKDPNDSYLLQEEISCEFLTTQGGLLRPAYWRIIHCLGEQFAFWWKPNEYCSPGEPSYIPLAKSEILKFGLMPVLNYAKDLKSISGMDWFSTELCLARPEISSRHRVQLTNNLNLPVVSIDYFNDQCDVNAQSRWIGAPPDETVALIANRFALQALRLKNHQTEIKAA